MGLGRFKNNKIPGFLSCLIILSLGITGCGTKKTEEAPELLEPASEVTFIRPVSYKYVSNPECLMGVVVPDSSYVISEKSVLIKSIEVNIGDSVSKGDIVAYGEVSVYEDEIKRKEEELSQLEATKKNESIIADEKIKQLGYKKAAAEYVGNTENVSEFDKEISIENENKRYSEALKNAAIEELSSDIKKLKEEKEKLVFTATSDGRVTFIKDLSATPTAGVNEAIVVISDFDDYYIEVPKLTIDKYKFKNYTEKYAYIDGKRAGISEYEYSSEEVSYATSNKTYPCMRFKPDDESLSESLNVGDNLLLYFEKNEARKVLAVGLDSVNKDESGAFVYVCEDKNDNNFELIKRYIKTGAEGSHYIEVTEGLSEGELVYYSSDSVVPLSYSEETVVRGEYKESYKTDIVVMSDNDVSVIAAKDGGVISDIYASVGDEVDKDSQVCLIDTQAGQARLTELKTLMSSADTEHEKAVKEFDEREKALNEELALYAGMEAPVASETDALEDYLYKDEEIKSELAVLSTERAIEASAYESNKKLLNDEYVALNNMNNGSGGNICCATSEGKIGYINVSKSDIVNKGDFIYSVVRPTGDIYKVMISSSVMSNQDGVSAALGSRVSLYIDGKKYETTCAGKNGYNGRYYIFTGGDKQYAAYMTPYKSGTNEQFFIRLDDDTAGEIAGNASEDNKVTAEFDNLSLDGVIAIPAKAIYQETDKLSGGKAYYVWMLENDMIVKEYVETLNGTEADGKKPVIYGVDEGDILLVE